MSVEVRDPSGNAMTGGGYIPLGPTLDVETPLPAMTGHPYTVASILPDDYTIPAPGGCRWEFRWGNDKSLDTQDHDETYASLLFDIPAVGGKCARGRSRCPGSRSCAVRGHPGAVHDRVRRGNGGFGIGVTKRIPAALDSTNQRITSSSLPLAQVLPSTYTPIVGRPVTYTEVPGRRGVELLQPAVGRWQGSGDHPTQWNQNGRVHVHDHATTGPATSPSAGIAPAATGASGRSTTLPSATATPAGRTRPRPCRGSAAGRPASLVPVSLTWSGTDRGWGIRSYKLQQSVDGGSWTTIALPTAKTRTIVRMVPVGTKVRYRVRATDKAGNVGSWDDGPAFRPRTYAETNANIVYRRSWTPVDDATAYGGHLRESTVSGARATFSFRARDIAWMAERGPGHGTAKVYVDGILRTTIDLDATTDSPRRIVYRRHWSTLAHHTIRVVVNGTGIVGIDGFIALK